MTAIPQPPAPPAPTPVKKTWLQRNWIWMLVAGCVLVLVLLVTLIGGAIVLGFNMMKRADAYQMAMERLRATPAVVEKLGQPIEEGWYASGQIHISGPDGTASLEFPVHGPSGSASVYVRATRASGQWTLDELVVEIEDTGERISVSIEDGSPDAPPRAPPTTPDGPA